MQLAAAAKAARATWTSLLVVGIVLVAVPFLVASFDRPTTDLYLYTNTHTTQALQKTLCLLVGARGEREGLCVVCSVYVSAAVRINFGRRH
jgi:hypothetical protein